MELFIVVIAGVIVGVALLIWFGLRDPQKIQWELVVIGITILVLTGCCAGLTASGGGLGVVIAFFAGVIAAGTAFISGLVLVFKLYGKHKLFGVLIGLVFPAALFLSIEIGDQYSPESVAQANGTIVAQALDQYRADYGSYPNTLDELVPTYLTDLREPKTIWGWLYQVDENDFSLGFVYNVDRDGYSIYLYRSDTDKWEFLPLHFLGPFNLPPTPMP